MRAICVVGETSGQGREIGEEALGSAASACYCALRARRKNEAFLERAKSARRIARRRRRFARAHGEKVLTLLCVFKPICALS
jgi:hypothetical protein